MASVLDRVTQKAQSRERLTRDDALELFQTRDVIGLENRIGYERDTLTA